ncbi:MAG: hypothetical protein ACIAQU_03055 [Phycisphaerales bacterium JB064]
MSEEPLVLDSVGLEIQIPRDSTGFRADQGDVPTLEISPDLGHWYLLVKAPQQRAANPESGQRQVGGNLPVDDLTERILENLLGSYRDDRQGTEGIESRARVLVREKGLVIAGRPASRFYVAFPESTREGSSERIRMYTLVDAGAGQMVSFDLFCEPKDQEEARLAYLAVLSSAQFSGNTQVAVARAVGIETTEALLTSLTSGDYERALAQVNERWDRLKQPAGTGLSMDDTERGYRYIRAWKGKQGEINPERSEENWSEQDHRVGYIVRMDGRMVERLQSGQWNIVDTRVICFMTPDRQHESWTASTTFRMGDQRPVVNSEFGVREGQEMKVARRGSTSNTFQPAVPPRGYVNQVEFYLLPQLLVGNEAPATYGVYAYTIGDTSVRYRQFELEAISGQAAWRLTTELGEESRSISLFDQAGEFMGSDRGDGSQWSPTTKDALLNLWSRKGLPTSTR